MTTATTATTRTTLGALALLAGTFPAVAGDLMEYGFHGNDTDFHGLS